MRMSYSTRLHYLNINIGWMHYHQKYDKPLQTLILVSCYVGSTRKQYETLCDLLKAYLRAEDLPEDVESSLKFFLNRVRRKCCNANSKYMYFCDLKETHKGNHSDKGFQWSK